MTETSSAIAGRASMTERARAEACRRVGQEGHSVAQVASAFGVGWATVMRAVRDHGPPLVEDPLRLADVTALGVDETAFLAANRRHATTFVTGIVDLSGAPRLLDVVLDRSSAALSGWLSARDGQWRQRVGVAALDPFRGYETALRTALPHTVRVLDGFHVSKLGFAMRWIRSATAATSTTRCTERGGCCCAKESRMPTAKQRAQLESGLAAGDPDGEVAVAYLCAQQIRAIYQRTDPTAGPGARRAAHRRAALLPHRRSRPARPDAAVLAPRTSPPTLPRTAPPMAPPRPSI